MAQFIQHRVNTIEALRAVPPEYGVEIDLRSHVDDPGSIHLSHDAWAQGVGFDDWLDVFASRPLAGPIILNTKEDGLEERAMTLLARFGLDNFFFLDTTIPTLVRWCQRGLGERFAVRVSRYESASIVAMLQALPSAPRWAWVDCFDGEPMDAAELKRLEGRQRICLVSPELQGKPDDWIHRFKDLYPLADAICTKKPQMWRSLAA